MRFLLVCARKDLKRHLADPLALVIWIGIPIMIGGLMSLIGGSGGSPPTARLLVVNQDTSVIGNLLAGGLGQGGANGFLSVEEVDLDTGQERIGDGDGTALLIVPEGFGSALLEDEPTVLTLITNPAQRILRPSSSRGWRFSASSCSTVNAWREIRFERSLTACHRAKTAHLMSAPSPRWAR